MPAIEIVKGDLFESGADAIVLPVNTKGVMGAGLAKTFARRFPTASHIYRQQCRRGDTQTGQVMHAHATRDLVEAGITWAFFFPTKEHWRDPSRLEWIESGLEDLRDDLDPDGSALGPIKLLAIPALGCGVNTGQLSWATVRPLIQSAARRMFCAQKVLIFEPHE